MKPPKPTAMEQAVKLVKHLTADERIALMKAISASLNGPRLYTSEDVQDFMLRAVNEYIEGQKTTILTPQMVRRGQ